MANDEDFEIASVRECIMSQMIGLEGFPIARDIVAFGRRVRDPFGREPKLAPGQRGARCFAGMDGRIVHNDGTRFGRRSRLGAMDVIEPFEQGDALRQELRTAPRFCCEVTTVSFRETKSSALIMAIFCNWPGAGTRNSAPRFAHARARLRTGQHLRFIGEQQQSPASACCVIS